MSRFEVYSNLSLEEALDDSAIPDDAMLAVHHAMAPYLSILEAPHLSYDDRLLQGQVVVHEGMREIFSQLFAGLIDLRYPIYQVRPMVEFGWSDAAAMAANNTSVYRPDFIRPDMRVSEHTRGSAGDFNPFDNPLRNPDHTIEPPEAMGHLPRLDAVLHRRLDVIDLLHELGLEYGGYWDDPSHPEDYFGQDPATGELRYILADCHHVEARPHIVERLEVPAGLWN